MRVTTITFAVLRKTQQFENDRAEVTVELEPGDSVEDARTLVVSECEATLGRAQDFRNEAKLDKASRVIDEASKIPGGPEALAEVAASIIRRNQMAKR